MNEREITRMRSQVKKKKEKKRDDRRLKSLSRGVLQRFSSWKVYVPGIGTGLEDGL